jgi:uncharacterized repeat protein (TIGR03803 family)
MISLASMLVRELARMLCGCALLLLLLAASGAANATSSMTTLYSFSGWSDGMTPLAPLARGSDGNFYGTTSTEGTATANGQTIGPGAGTIFSITPAGQLTTLYVLRGMAATTDGIAPNTRLAQDSAGNFYGATQYQGPSKSPCTDCGTVFKLASDGTETVLRSFTDSVYTGTSQSAHANELVVGGDGYLYGTAAYGNSSSATDPGCGSVYRMTTNGVIDGNWGFTFGSTPDDGCSPVAGLVRGSDGNFYGTTTKSPPGASTSYGGTIFKITPDGHLTTLFRFTNLSDGTLPQGKLIEGADGSLYGTTTYGGAYHVGGIFKITPDGVFTSLYSFVAYEGYYPAGDITFGSDGNIYGTTAFTIFRLTTDGMLTQLWYDSTNGDMSALAPGDNGDFFLTTKTGGANGDGTVSRFVPESPDVSVIATITATASTITLGQSSTISWGSLRAAQCKGYGSVSNWNPNNATSGSFTFSPTQAGSYYFANVCSNGTQKISAESVAVTVSPLPPSVTITASPSTIALSDSSILSWTSVSTTGCTASGAWSGAQATSGSLLLTPTTTGTGTYTLTCTVIDGSTVSASATLTTTQAPSPTLTFSASPTVIHLGSSSLLSWTTTYAVSCNASGGWSGTEPTSGTLWVAPTSTGYKTYTLVCKGVNGRNVRHSAHIFVLK